MARKPRVHFAGAFYHVIARGNKGAKVFKTPRDYSLYRQFLKEYKERYSFILYAYVLMPTHVHLLIEVQEKPLSKIMQSLQFRYTSNYNVKYGTWGHLFQGRYKAFLCEKDIYLLELSAYIHLNPVRAGLVEDPSDYPWSSYRAYAFGADEDVVDPQKLLGHFSPKRAYARKEFLHFVKARMGQGKREDFYKPKDQRFLGSDEFLEEIRARKRENDAVKYHLSIAEIVSGVASKLAITNESMHSKNRNREGALGRGIVGYLAGELTSHSLKSVADHFARDPVVICQGTRRIERILRENKELRERITGLKEKLTEGKKRILI